MVKKSNRSKRYTPELRKEILDALNNGATPGELIKKYGITYSTLHDWRRPGKLQQVLLIDKNHDTQKLARVETEFLRDFLKELSAENIDLKIQIKSLRYLSRQYEQ
jgi:transposase-like protein